MRTQYVFRKITWLAHCVAFAFAAFSIEAADSGIITFQESSAPSSENDDQRVRILSAANRVVLQSHWPCRRRQAEALLA
jgi:hypothetical protein